MIRRHLASILILKLIFPYSKWYISYFEWIDDLFWPYCSGSAYILTPQIGSKLFQTFLRTFKENYVWIEDVYLTGILADLANIGRIHVENLVYFEIPNSTSDFFTAHPYLEWNLSPQERLKVWHELFDPVKWHSEPESETEYSSNDRN